MTEPRDERQAWQAYQWAKAIKLEHGKTVESVLAIGNMFIAAKRMLPHGEFQHIFVGIPFDRRTAELYMSIAHNRVLANAKWISHLPSMVGTLYELSRIAEPVLETALTDERICPKLRRPDVRKLFKSKPPLITWSLTAAEERLRQAINAEIRDASETERESIIALLQVLTDELKQAQDQSRRDDVQAARDELEAP